MVKSIKDLRRADRFWPWLFRTALGKVQCYYREQKQKREIHMWAITKERLLSCSIRNDGGISDKMVRYELSEAVFQAMGKLTLNHRNVLVLRCFEQVPFEEIAEMLDCSELSARVMFFRAKHSLRQKLSRRGFGKKTLFVMAVGLFGLLTAPAKAGTAAAATSVTAASFEVGPAAALIGFLGTKAGICTAAVLSALTVTLAVKAFLLFLAFLCFVIITLFVAAFSK
jgi:RNA polymerase sigma factor (sigma-70 family)